VSSRRMASWPVFGVPSGKRLVTGIGSGRPSSFLRPDDYDDVVLVDDLAAIATGHRLRNELGLGLGGSSGAVIAARVRPGTPVPTGPAFSQGRARLGQQLKGELGPGQLSLADRGFFSMDRWLRFSAAGAHLLWRVKNAAIRVLTTLLDPGAFPAAEIAALYAARWQVETAFLHLKKTVWPTEEAAYDLTIVPSNLPKADTSPRT
jgi:hypothetical protein